MAGTILTFAGGTVAWLFSVLSGPNWLQIPLSPYRFNITADLGPILSNEASIYVPGSEGFADATQRWIPWMNPSFDVVVEVGNEADVENTIRYANAKKTPFLAISGQHGATETLAKVKHGIGIWMRKLQNVEIAENGKSAIIGGGIKTKALYDALWVQGKQTVAGCCECTGAAAGMLGGGHGWLQGQHGLMSDNLISARLVLANGTAISVSVNENPQLFWAIQGAGHNFGIVTSFESKIYEITAENKRWAYETLIFTGDKLEQVFEVVKSQIEDGGLPAELINMALWAFVPDVDLEKPAILVFLIYNGNAVPPEYSNPFLNQGPISHTTNTTNLLGLASALGFTNEAPCCWHSNTLLRHPTYLENYNIAGLRKAYDIFSKIPNPFRNFSLMALEAYSTQGVQSISEDYSAYAGRSANLLLSPFVSYVSDPTLDSHAAEYGRKIRQALLDASEKPLKAYLNYAHGDESQEAIYGYAPWRLEKLRMLKRQYDPEGKFNYYNPIQV